jgi:hypothetical protein
VWENEWIGDPVTRLFVHCHPVMRWEEPRRLQVWKDAQRAAMHGSRIEGGIDSSAGDRLT